MLLSQWCISIHNFTYRGQFTSIEFWNQDLQLNSFALLYWYFLVFKVNDLSPFTTETLVHARTASWLRSKRNQVNRRRIYVDISHTFTWTLKQSSCKHHQSFLHPVQAALFVLVIPQFSGGLKKCYHSNTYECGTNSQRWKKKPLRLVPLSHVCLCVHFRNEAS